MTLRARAIRRAAGLSVVVGLVAALLLPGSAFGHALLQHSSPSPGAQLSTSPSQVTITFGERPDAGLSTIKVLDASGAAVTAGPTEAVAGQPLTLAVALRAGLGDGVYTVAWRTVSAVDGHLASG